MGAAYRLLSAGILDLPPEFRTFRRNFGDHCSILQHCSKLRPPRSSTLSERTIQRMIAAGSMTGYVDWDEIASKLIPIRPRRQ
jgi:hypothetical protein